MVAARIFAGLWHCVREVDFVGWFREDRVAGAVLTQGADPPAPDVPLRISHRITGILSERVPAAVARRLHVRVLQLRPARRVERMPATGCAEPRQTRLRARDQLRGHVHVLTQELFRDVLTRERKRADRFDEPVVLLLIELDDAAKSFRSAPGVAAKSSWIWMRRHRGPRRSRR